MEDSASSSSASIANPSSHAAVPDSVRETLQRCGAGEIRLGWPSHDDLSAELVRRGIEVRPFRIDGEGFERYVRESGYAEMPYWHHGAQLKAREKYLEHYVSLELLEIGAGDVVLDIASCTSPWPDIVRRRYGCRVWRQDLTFPAGVEGDRIGGDAAALPVATGFADKIALHCSFEHFEGDRDSAFLREAGRLLRPGGRLCSLPLYLSKTFSIQTDPAAWEGREPEFDADAVTWLVYGWGESHGRLYDLDRFLSRVVAHLGDLELVVYRMENATEVVDDSHLRFAALLVKPTAAGELPAGLPGEGGPWVDAAADPTGHLERTHRDHAAELAAVRRETADVRARHEVDAQVYRDQIARLEALRGTVTHLEATHAAARESYENAIASLEGALRDTVTRHHEELVKLREGHLQATEIYEGEIARVNDARAGDLATFAGRLETLTNEHGALWARAEAVAARVDAAEAAATRAEAALATLRKKGLGARLRAALARFPEDG